LTSINWTPEPTDLYWDSINEWFFARVHDQDGYGEYHADSPAFDVITEGNFHFEFDINIALQDWGNYPGIRLLDSYNIDRWVGSNYAMNFNFGYADVTPRQFELEDTGSAHHYKSPYTVVQDRWYHVDIDYDAQSLNVDLIVTDLTTGLIFWQLADAPFVITEPIDTVGIGQRTTPPKYGDISDMYIDNISISIPD
jgi:hypothetical protein